MKLGLGFPQLFKLVEIILTVKHLVAQAVVGVLVKLFHLELPYGLLIEIEFLAAVANGA